MSVSGAGAADWLPCASRLVGRSAEFARLTGLRRDVLDSGTGQLALVTGEAGVGKSRLVAEIAAAARADETAVLTGRCMPDSDAFRPLEEALAGALRHRPVPADPALRPYLPALAHLLPAVLPGGSAGPTSRVMIAEGVLRLLGSLTAGRGAVLVLEDLQWADPDTLDVLSYLCHAAEGSRLLVLGTARDDTDLPERLLDLTASCSAAVVHLTRLHRDDVREMLAACMSAPPPDELLDFMVEHADGIPFLVEELLRGMASVGAIDGSGRLFGPLQPSVPRTFAATVRRRLDGMQSPQRQVVEVAAVLGRRFDWRRIAPSLQIGEPQVLAALRTLVATGLVEAEDEDTFRFRHALSRDAVLGELLPPERARLIRAVAEVVERAEEESGDLAAALWAAAGERGRAARLYIRAGASARRRAALHTAERSLRRAVALAGSTADRSDAEHGLLDVLAASGDTEQALLLGERLLAAGDESVRLTLAEVAATAGRRDRARAWLAGLPEDGSPRGSVLIARIAHEEGRPDEARDAANRALSAATAAGLWSVACEALEVIGRADRVGDPAAARRAFAAAEQLAVEHELPVERISALHELGTIDLLVDGATELLQRARALAEEAGMLGTGATLDVQLAAALTHRDPDRALVHATRSAEQARRLRMDRLRATALMFAAAVYADRRDTVAMEREVRTALALAPDDLDVNAGIWGAVRAHVALLDNDRDQLARCLDTAMGYLRRSPTTTPAPTRGLWALVRTLDGDDGAARAEARPSDVNWQNAALLDYADAVAYGRAGQPAEAERAFAAADAAMARLPWWRHRVRLLIADAAREDGWGDPNAWVREALPVFTDREDAPLVAACRGYLRTAGEPVPRAGRGRGRVAVPATLSGAGVTGREMEVLDLAVQGHSDADIARRLYLSPRTVETHMRNLRDKTGAPNRQALIERVKSGVAAR